MLSNYLITAWRNLRRNPGYAALNVGGLSIGLAASFLIVLFVQHELTYDRFHERGARLYRVLPAETGGSERRASSPSGLGPDLTTAFPEVEEAVRVATYMNPYLQVGSERRRVDGFLVADASFFDIFSFPLLRGDPAAVLQDPHALVVSESAARTLFGDADPIGKTVTLGSNDLDLTVTGIAVDVPSNSHLRFDYVVPFALIGEWYGEQALHEYTNFNYRTYLLLRPGVDADALEAKMATWIKATFNLDSADAWAVDLQPLEAIHFTTDVKFDDAPTRDMRYLYSFLAVGVLLLLIACINFMNLTTARGTRRAKEVGLRKTLGAVKGQLAAQFVGEALLQSLVAVVLALSLVTLLLPAFNDAIGSSVHFDARQGATLALLLGIGLGTGLLAGSYPAFYLAAFQPTRVLKGEVTRGTGGAWLRKALIVFQFAASVALIIGTLVVYRQLHFMRSQALGFDQEHVVLLSPPGEVWDQYASFRSALLSDARIVSVARSTPPGLVGTNRTYNWPGQERTGQENGRSLWTVFGDPDYLETMGVALKEGRGFSWDVPADTQDTYILNETAVRELGIEDPVGHPFRAWDRPMGRVIGVVEDFHFQSLHRAIEPLVINYKPWYSTIAVRLAEGDVPAALDHLRRQWQTFAPGFAFDYTFLDERFDRAYRADAQLMQRFGFFAAIAIFVACLGLFGLAAYTAEQRTKEIGVRKTFGASVPNIFALLSKDFLMLVLIAFVVATPAAYFVMERWLAAFAYRIELSWPIFLLAGSLALAIALLTVSYQAIKAALADPVKSLRYE